MVEQQHLKQLAKQLPDCMNGDRHVLRRQIDRLRSQIKKGSISEQALDKIRQKLEQSIARRELRQAQTPTINFPDLPVSDKKDEISDLIKKNQVIILCGETGSGKTTQLPKICLSLGLGAAGMIGHTQPRRIAARSVANRIAEEIGEKLGNTVGYKVRFHDQVDKNSLVKLMTDGILLAEIQSDPYLNQYEVIIIDEAHERSLNIDFLLGYMHWLLPRRKDLKLIITSATIDPERFADHFNQAPVINVSGRTYPVDIRYRPIELLEEDDETSADLQQGMLEAVSELQREMPGDILIFLNGEQEIRETSDSLTKHGSKHYDILPLYSKLSVSEQERVFKTGGRRRIVLATNVAETSLTVPGIRSVIDTGHARISRYSHRSKIQRLPIEKISQASANQRAGRCGRVAEGICIRLYSEQDFQLRTEFTEPEILRTNLASVILQMTSLKLGDIEKFPFVESPDDKMIRDGKSALHEVHALDKNGKITETGRKLAKIPADPKLARMILAANEFNCLNEVCVIVAALSIQDPREKPADKMQQADAKHAAFKADDSDFLSLFNLWNVYQQKKAELSNNQLRKYCKTQFLSYLRMREWADIYQQIKQVVSNDFKFKYNSNPANYEAVHSALLPGLLSNIGFRHEQYEYLGARNLKFFIFPGSGQYKARPKWIMAAEQVETSKIYARTVAKIEPEWIERAASHLVKFNYYEPHWEKKAARCAIYERTLLYGLTLQPKRKRPYENIDPKAAREIFIRSALVEQDYQTRAPFFKANQLLLEEVGMIQHKGRRLDLVEDEEWLYQFYDQILPEDVVNGITLDQWRKKQEKLNPKILFLTKEALTRDNDKAISDRDYPDHINIAQLRIALDYRFEPGHAEDGVTAVIPIHQLNQVKQSDFEWLVPGLLEEKLVALLKALPKASRKLFVPVPQTVERCLLAEPDNKGHLFEWLSRRLRQLTGESVPLNLWSSDGLNPHLQMNFRIIDDQGKILASGRQLNRLQNQFSHDAKASFEQIAAEELNHTGCIQWAFDDLPETHEFVQQGQKFLGYPAIVDEGSSVGVRIFDTRTKAELSHRQGLIRLFYLQTRKQAKFALSNLRKSQSAELAYNRLKPHPILTKLKTGDFREDMITVLIATVFVESGDIRSQQQFESCLSINKSRMVSMGAEVGQLCIDIMQKYQQIKPRLDQVAIHKVIAEDVKEQLDLLLYSGCFKFLNRDRLRSILRYLKAIEYRLEKQKYDPQQMQSLQRYWNRYWQKIETLSKKQLYCPEADKFRWDLEEFRVSLFAQSLKTAYPISEKRLDKAWDSFA